MLAAVRDGYWYWGLGDPDTGAVFVTVLYFVTAMACLVKGRRIRRAFSADADLCSTENDQSSPASTRSKKTRKISGEIRLEQLSQLRFWLGLGVVICCLGINKQADLQSLLTLYGRGILHDAGLYEARRAIQVAFIGIVMLVAALITLLTLKMVRTCPWPCQLAAIGLGLQSTFVVIRAASFHHMDRLLGLQLADLKINLLLESIGLITILLAAIARERTSSREKFLT